jgi:hypothetical protein
MSVEVAYQRAMDTVHLWVQKEVDASKTLAVFRTYSPAHTRHTYVVICWCCAFQSSFACKYSSCWRDQLAY